MRLHFSQVSQGKKLFFHLTLSAVAWEISAFLFHILLRVSPLLFLEKRSFTLKFAPNVTARRKKDEDGNLIDAL